jgi:uncharacterized protein (TIGR02145 family)
MKVKTATLFISVIRRCFPKKLSKAISLALSLIWIVGIRHPLDAQTVIGGVVADPSSVLDLQSNNKGLLLPRLTTSQRNDIESPQTGLIIYNTTLNCMEVNKGTPESPDWACVSLIPPLPPGSITALACSAPSMVMTDTLIAFKAATGVTARVLYTGGNGGSHSGQTVSSTGALGLTATLDAGNFVNGADTLVYTITGTPESADTAKFALSIGGQTCTLQLVVQPPVCRAKISATAYKNFMCYNLAAASTSIEPFKPDWQLNGGYWQWGTKGPNPSVWLNTNTVNFAHGPTGSGAGQANSSSPANWSTSIANDTDWQDGTKTANDPCPTGYRIPTSTQWDNVVANNNTALVGNWTNSETNYSSGRMIGTELFLPAAGYRGGSFYESDKGYLENRGASGHYWSSTYNSLPTARNLFFSQGGIYTNTSLVPQGMSIRCIEQ